MTRRVLSQIARRHRLALWVLVIVFIVFPWRSLQDHTHWQSIQWIPFVSPPVRVRDIVGNIALYVPFGWFYMQRGRVSPIACLGWAFLLSLATEASQLYSHGRFPSVQDLLMNVIGATLGVVAARSSGGAQGLKMSVGREKVISWRDK